MSTIGDFTREIAGDAGPARTIAYVGLDFSGVVKTWQQRGNNTQTIALVAGNNGRRRHDHHERAQLEEDNLLVGTSQLKRRRVFEPTRFTGDGRQNVRPEQVHPLSSVRTLMYHYEANVLNGANNGRRFSAVPLAGFIEFEAKLLACKFLTKVPHHCAFKPIVRRMAAALQANLCDELMVSQPTVLNCRYDLRNSEQCRSGIRKVIEELSADDLTILENIDPSELIVSIGDDGRYLLESRSAKVYADEVRFNLDPNKHVLTRAQIAGRLAAHTDLPVYHSSFLGPYGRDCCDLFGSGIANCECDHDGAIFFCGFAADCRGSGSCPNMSGSVAIYRDFNPFDLVSRSGLVPEGTDARRFLLVVVEIIDTAIRVPIRAHPVGDTVLAPITNYREMIASVRCVAKLVNRIREVFQLLPLDLVDLIAQLRQENPDGTINLRTLLTDSPMIRGAAYKWITQVDHFYDLGIFERQRLDPATVSSRPVTVYGR